MKGIKTMTENESKVKEKPNRKLFQKGGAPGPGRGHKKVKTDRVDTRDPLELAMQIIKKDLRPQRLRYGKRLFRCSYRF